MQFVAPTNNFVRIFIKIYNQDKLEAFKLFGIRDYEN